MENNKSIGVFDSGFGGLDILRMIVKKMPEYNYIYLGDTARAPYGSRSKELIYKFSQEAVEFLFKNNCELIILACNTASSDALRKIQREYLPKFFPKRQVLGVVIPATEEAVRKTKNNKIGVIATEATVYSKSFQREIMKINPQIKIFQKACPLLVPIVEAGEQNSILAEIALKKCLASFLRFQIDTLILGCTHYGLLENKIKKIIPSNISIISERNIIPKKLHEYLVRHPILEKKIAKKGEILFFTTDLSNRFVKLGSKFFGRNIEAKRAGSGSYPAP